MLVTKWIWWDSGEIWLIFRFSSVNAVCISLWDGSRVSQIAFRDSRDTIQIVKKKWDEIFSSSRKTFSKKYYSEKNRKIEKF